MQGLDYGLRGVLGTPLWFLLREAARSGQSCTVIVHFHRSRMTRAVRLHSQQARRLLAGEWE